MIAIKGNFPFLDYEWNKDYIANFLCINKDKPELHCNGKCYLKSQINKNNVNTNNPFPFPSPNPTKIIKPNYFISIFNCNLFAISTYDKTIKTEYKSLSISNPELEIPTPPPKIFI